MDLPVEADLPPSVAFSLVASVATKDEDEEEAEEAEEEVDNVVLFPAADDPLVAISTMASTGLLTGNETAPVESKGTAERDRFSVDPLG